MSDWSELQFQTANRFIHQQIRRYGHFMAEDECIQECWRAFLAARRSYLRVSGCCRFTTYAERHILEALDLLRRHRNQRISLESNFSLDMRYEGCSETMRERYFRKTGDCSDSVALWDFAQRQGELKYRILRQLYNQLEDWEIIAENHLRPESYYALLSEIQEAFEEWERL